MMLVAAPVLGGAAISLFFRRVWQRVVLSGAVAAAVYAAVLYAMQADMVRRGPPSVGMTLAEPVVAAEVAVVVAPVGMCAALVLHLITRYIRKNKA